MLINGFKIELIRVAIGAGAALAIGFAWGHPIAVLLIAGVLYLLQTYRKISTLLSWLNKRDAKPPINLDGIWADLADIIYRDRKKLKRIQERRLQALQRVKDISMAIRDGIVILDTQRQLEWSNIAAQNMLRLKRDDIGKPILNTLRHPSFKPFLDTRSPEQSITFSPPHRAGLTCEVSAAPFGEDSQETVLIFRDVTRLSRLERTRKDFVANISHELRTPLTVINGYIDNFETALDGPLWDKAVNQMRSQSNRITALADDLTMLSKLESESYQHKMEQLPVKQLLESVVNDAQRLSSKHTVKLIIPNEDIVLNGNYQQLYSAFSNLVVNAIRHNPNGCDIDVTTSIETNPTTITVSDNGKGIPAAHIPRLTERFYRADADRNSFTGGTGLGLAIVKHVLQHHTSDLEISSVEGEGATFSARFVEQPEQRHLGLN